jgi:ATP-binding protein involved in chromosome partitioning
MDMTFLGEVPLDLKIRQGGDRGIPVTTAYPDSDETKTFMAIASRVAARISQENAARQAAVIKGA